MDDRKVEGGTASAKSFCLLGSTLMGSLLFFRNPQYLSIAVDASRLGKRSVLLGAAALPSNLAAWMPPQDRRRGVGGFGRVGGGVLAGVGFASGAGAPVGLLWGPATRSKI